MKRFSFNNKMIPKSCFDFYISLKFYKSLSLHGISFHKLTPNSEKESL